MNFSIILDNIPIFLNGLWTTIHLIGLSLSLGFIFSIPCALIRHLKIPILNQIVVSYTYFFRSTPLLLQIYLIYYGSGQFEWIKASWLWLILEDSYTCVLLAFTLNTIAYTTEMFRNALDTMSAKEIEAGYAFGMSKPKIYKRVIIPNSLRRCIPPYSNEVIFLLHSSSLASVVTLMDLTGTARFIYSKYYDPFTPFVTIAVMYICIVFILVYAFKKIEAKYLKHLDKNSKKINKAADFGNPI